jgi:penicillin G amidase
VALRRILRYLNFAIGAALLVLIIAAYWYAWRPLPQTSGVVEAPVAGRAVVSRDALGVPHIMAASLSDALFVQGYVTAQDRLFQMDAMRRMAAGELAEVLGPAGLASDREARQLRLRRIGEAYSTGLPPPDRAALAAYARGVNQFILTHKGQLPLEFTLLGYEPRPWSIVDSLLIVVQMMNTMDRSWRRDLQMENVLQGGDPAKVNLLYSVGTRDQAGPASNAWALSGAHTVSRRPLLAGDPHLEFSLPPAWHVVQIGGPRLNVYGVTLPGVPGVLAGHNARIAWSITSLPFDVQDLYIEKFDLASGRYMFRGQMEQAAPEREVIRVKGAVPVGVMQWVTRHGPIFQADGGRFLSLRWAAADTAGVQFPILDLNRARDWTEFRSALARFPGPGMTFVYADILGNIGSQTAGRFPIRSNFDGRVPLDGASGKSEWDGFIPFDKLPSTFNPASGMVISANQNPFPGNFEYTVSGNFASPYRVNQIASRLKSKPAWQTEEMLSVQTDAYSALSHFLAQEFVAAYARRGRSFSDLAPSVDLLRKWNGQMLAGRAEPLMLTLAYQHLRSALAECASPGKGLAYGPRIAPAVVEKLLREKPQDWFPDYDQFLLSNLRDAIEEGRRMQGRDVAKWDYGRTTSLSLANPVVGRLPLVGKYFNLGPVALSGSPETVNQVGKVGNALLGPSMRMLLDLAKWDASLLNLTLGESGQVLSPHYKDQWKAYLAGRSFPAPFNKFEAKGTLTFLPEK